MEQGNDEATVMGQVKRNSNNMNNNNILSSMKFHI
jgi:hypothetical protein